jgi:hypothetical protein
VSAPSVTTANSVIDLPSTIPSSECVIIDYYPQLVTGANISIAFVTNTPIWFEGWTQNQAGSYSAWQSGTLLEAANPPNSQYRLPLSLPNEGQILPFLFQVLGETYS